MHLHNSTFNWLTLSSNVTVNTTRILMMRNRTNDFSSMEYAIMRDYFNSGLYLRRLSGCKWMVLQSVDHEWSIFVQGVIFELDLRVPGFPQS